MTKQNYLQEKNVTAAKLMCTGLSGGPSGWPSGAGGGGNHYCCFAHKSSSLSSRMNKEKTAFVKDFFDPLPPKYIIAAASEVSKAATILGKF